MVSQIVYLPRKNGTSEERQVIIVGTPPPPRPGGGGGGGEGGGRLNLKPNFQNLVGGDMTGPQLLEGGCWERGG